MTDGLFSERSVAQALEILKNEIPFAIWETFYVTVLSTFFAVLIGLPLGVLLVAGEKDGVLPLPRWLMTVLNVLVNLLRSIPFLILMIMVIPLSRLIVGTSIARWQPLFRLLWRRFRSLRGWWRPLCAS